MSMSSTTKLHSAPQTDESAALGNGDDGAPIILHPLVVLNVSDHYTRYAAIRQYDDNDNGSSSGDRGAELKSGLSDDNGNPRVIGLLLGIQRGRIIEVCHSVELTGEAVDGQVSIDTDFMQSRIEQYQQIFAQYTVVGWYSTRTGGCEISKDDLRLHDDVFTVLNETPIFLVMNPTAHHHHQNHDSSLQLNKTVTPATSSTIARPTDVDINLNTEADDNAMKTEHETEPDSNGNGNENKVNATNSEQQQQQQYAIPSGGYTPPGMLTTYQMELKVVDNKPTKLLVEVSHRYASEDSERIAVDHVMRHAVPGGGGGTSSTALHLASLRSSIKMLHERLRVIAKFLHATVNHEIPVDHELLRQVSSVCARLPALDCIEFADAFADEENDSLVVSYLGGLTKTMCSLSEALEMFTRFNVRPSSTGPPRRRSVFSRS